MMTSDRSKAANGQRVLGCCGGTTDGSHTEHKANCPSVIRAALSWIEDTAYGEKIRVRALAVLEQIVRERDDFEQRLHAYQRGER